MARILAMKIQVSAMIRGLEKTLMQLQFVYSVLDFGWRIEIFYTDEVDEEHGL